MKTADGSSMASPDRAAEVSMRFSGSSSPTAQYSHDFMFHRSNRAPSIIGNDFWHRHKALFNYPLECIQLMNADVSIDNSIPFRCRRPQPYSDAVAAATEEQSLGSESRIPVRARETVVLRPREGCVIQPQLDCELGSLNHSDTLVMAPELSAVRAVLDDTKRSGCSQVALPLYTPGSGQP